MSAYLNAELADFLIQQTTYIEVLPNFEQELVHFISGTFGPFKINQNVTIPLWMAIHLKKSNKCRILQPQWLTVEYLKAKFEDQKAKDDLVELPNHYYEIAKILFANCLDDLQNDAELKLLIEDLKNLRESKAKDKLKQFVFKQYEVMKFNNINQHERNLIQTNVTDMTHLFNKQIMESQQTQ